MSSGRSRHGGGVEAGGIASTGRRVLAVLMAGLIPVACAAETVPAEVAVSSCDTIARLKRGGILAVRLESQITAGYSWGIVSQTTGILKSQGEPKVERGKVDVDGGSEHQVFRFDAPTPGSDSLLFQYRRPWETGKPPLKSCLVSVEVQE